ncbi:Satratoxin biosynthesis SC3 cluster transcription factor SAT20 like protein [Verticillium longisporum]|uniref:Satratoxin biosynthesis SC3 cluster transcription factor SAT20 like protein n=1 Tax=Verticillium longisporum TaxID=100787 RepID=A0A8I2ZIE5_VERLO|nr:Satratoxin biosynthesis SC3 cluster transcription factor SAT20 like protein [Verticillium longisporum]
MNNPSLKRRRPFGHDDIDSLEPAPPDAFSHDSQEKRSQDDYRHVDNATLPRSSMEVPSLGGVHGVLGDSLAHLKMLMSSYQALAHSVPQEYGSSRPYETEKQPSALPSEDQSYLPMTIGPDPQSISQDVMFFPTTSAASGYFAAHSVFEVTHTANLPGGSMYNQEQLAGDQAPILPYSDDTPTVNLHLPLTPVVDATFNMANSYALSDSNIKREHFDAQRTSRNLDVVFTNSKPAAAKRGPFTDQVKREQTAETRRIGSCIRCRMQRIRCKANENDRHGACLTCSTKQNSKIWRLPCLRAKLTDVKLFKPGQVHGYEWTQRWKDSIVDNIASWDSPDERKIQISEGDKLDRSWCAKDGIKHSVTIPPYAIVDLDEAQRAYTMYIKNCIRNSFVLVLDRVLGAERNLLWGTYYLAWKLSDSQHLDKDETGLLKKVLELWMAVRLTTTSTVIVGNDTLGMPAKILNETSPQHGKMPLPPVMGAQIDLVLITHIQAKLRREMLDMLQKMTQANKQKTWLTTYLVTFILLHNTAMITEHDARYARKHGMKRRYAREEEVKQYQQGATILLAYFHYCNKGIFPFSDECRDQDLRGLAELDDQSMHFVHETRRWATSHKGQWEELQRKKAFEDSYFWVSQLYEHNWQPGVEL